MEPGRTSVVSAVIVLILDIGIAIAFGKQDAAVLDHYGDRAGDLEARELVFNQRIEESFEIGSRKLVDSRRLLLAKAGIGGLASPHDVGIDFRKGFGCFGSLRDPLHDWSDAIDQDAGA